MILIKIAFLILSYFFGSIPTGYLIGKFYGNAEVQESGSGATGGTNVARVTGKIIYGFLTLFFDMFVKGWLLVFIANSFFDKWFVVLAFAAILLGHVFPILTKFKGGKGIATLIGGLLALLPFGVFLLALMVWIFALSRTRGIISLSNLIIVSFILLAGVFINFSLSFFFFALFAAALIFWTHRSNLKRILQKKESRVILKVNWKAIKLILQEEKLWQKIKEKKPIEIKFE
ncbi:MAG: glycerol-3-phosphate acyltransferase [Candidatus Nealsonbacteria bacterium]